MRTIIINLTRFGDILQSQSVVSELAASGHRVGVVCLENFAPAAHLLAHVDAVFPLPGGNFLAALDADWRVAAARVQAFAHEIQTQFEPTCVVNLTSTLAGRLLARFISMQGGGATSPLPLRGFGVDAHGFGVNGTLWTAFFEAASRRRGCSPFNIVDVFRKSVESVGLIQPPPDNRLRPPNPECVQRVVAWPERTGSAGTSAPLIALQLGASETRRQWPVASFAQVGAWLTKAGYRPVLVGSRGERPLAEAYAAYAHASGTEHEYADFVGRTTLPELAALLSTCALLITNDTGTMHLAAGLNVPSVALFLATAQPWDTGPYLENCLCLEPDLPCHPCGFGTTCPHDEQCREAISPDEVWACVRARLEGTPPQPVGGARIWRSVWRETPARIMDLESLSGHEKSGRTSWLRLQRHFYRQFLDCWDSTDTDTSTFHFTAPPPVWGAALLEDRAPLSAVLEQAIGLLTLVEHSGEMLACGSAPAQVGQRFLGALHRLTALFEQPAPYGGFDALGRLWLSATQERGDDLAGVTRLAGLLRRCLVAWLTALR